MHTLHRKRNLETIVPENIHSLTITHNELLITQYKTHEARSSSTIKIHTTMQQTSPEPSKHVYIYIYIIINTESN